MIIKKYSQFFENLNRSSAIIKSRMSDYERLKDFLTKSNDLGYAGKFTELLFNGVPYNEIINLYNSINDLKKKNIRVDIDKYENYEKILDDINSKLVNYKFKKIFNQFPKEQKELFTKDQYGGENTLSRDSTNLISRLYDVDDIKPFITKIARYSSKRELEASINRFLNSKLKNYNREDIKALIGYGMKLVFENENIIIVRVTNYDSMKEIGSDTSWCIAASDYTFNTYLKEGQTQYVILDYEMDSYDVKFKVAFTLNKYNKVIHAHDILDRSCITYTNELLQKNDVNTNAIHELVNPNLNIPDISSLGDIESYIAANMITEEAINKIIPILMTQLSNMSGNNNGVNKREVDKVNSVLYKIFNALKDKKGDYLLEEDITKYKSLFKLRTWNNYFDECIQYLSSKRILVASKPPSSWWKYPEMTGKFYKIWKIDIVEFIKHQLDVDKYYKVLKTDDSNKKKYGEALLYYCNTITDKDKKAVGWDINNINNNIELLSLYAKHLMGEQVNEERVKKLILKDDDKFNYSDYEKLSAFGIKYKLDAASIGHQCYSDIIKEDTIIVDVPEYKMNEVFWFILSHKEDFNIEIEYSRKFLLEDINKNVRFFGNEIVRRSSSITRVTTYSLAQICEKIYPSLQLVTNKHIKFKDDVKFPMEFEISVCKLINNPSKSGSRKIKVTIK